MKLTISSSVWCKQAILSPTDTQPAISTDSRFAPSQCETALLCNDVSHWLGTSLEAALAIDWCKWIFSAAGGGHIKTQTGIYGCWYWWSVWTKWYRVQSQWHQAGETTGDMYNMLQNLNNFLQIFIDYLSFWIIHSWSVDIIKSCKRYYDASLTWHYEW